MDLKEALSFLYFIDINCKYNLSHDETRKARKAFKAVYEKLTENCSYSQFTCESVNGGACVCGLGTPDVEAVE